MDLQDKVALVTGAGVRVGRALALALAREGARVVVHYHSSVGPAQEVVRLIETAGGDAVLIQADLQDPSAPQRLMDAAAKVWGAVDILVNNAAIFVPGDVAHTTLDNWEAHVAINLRAPFFLCQAHIAQLGERRGHIINIADWRGVRPGTQYMAYTLTKGALITMTQSMALGLAPNVQVNAIAPGAILPPPDKGLPYLERLAETRVPLKHPGSPEEVAQGMIYLLQSDFVTGQVLFVTGGQHL